MPKSSNWLGLDVFVLGIALFTSVPTASADIITYTFSGVVRAGSFSSGTVSLPQGIETNGTTLFNGTLTYDTAAGVPTLPGDPIAPQGYLYFPTPSSVDFSLFIEGLTWAADGTDERPGAAAVRSDSRVGECLRNNSAAGGGTRDFSRVRLLRAGTRLKSRVPAGRDE